MIKALITFVMVYVFWMLMTFSMSLDELIVGAAVSLTVTYVSREFLFTKTHARAMHPVRWLNAVIYFMAFLWEEAKAHARVVGMIITGRVNPAIVKIRADLDTDIGKTMVANSITLTPGTLTIRIGGKNMYVHTLNYSEKHDTGERFERLAARVFEHRRKWK
ncbi:MAG: cation:proton antiporter [Candidatus Aenigmatarchaeota archaeon]|nr:MAG: cation:proton antiporter [Candidatus Aenigmarchaeota archaeon]